MSICIFIAIIAFGIIITTVTGEMLKAQIIITSKYVAMSIAQNIELEYSKDNVMISDIDEEYINRIMNKRWTTSINNIQKDESIPTYFEIDKMFITKVIINNKILYNNENQINKSNMEDLSIDGSNKLFSKINNYIGNIQTEYPIRLDNEIIGQVNMQANSKYISIIYLSVIFIIIVLSIILLLIINFISKILTIPVTIPLSQLVKKMKDIVTGNYGERIVIKKPLKEINEIVEATNSIMQKMEEYSLQLQSQKDELEYKNSELEAQNDELILSKKRIEEAQAQLIQSENMAAIGQLTAAITHEINTPLGAIYSNTQILDMLIKAINENEAIKASGEVLDTFVQMKDINDINILACNKVIEIIKSLKIFSKVDQAEIQFANLNEGIRSVIILTSNLWKRKITIHEDYGDIPEIKCYGGLLNQVFMNIIVNAIQAIDNNGDLYIKTYSDNIKIYVTIKDTGSGIKKENISRIFDNGFTTKEPGKGMGLGLSISLSIIRRHKGYILVNSEEEKGTKFTIVIPKNITDVQELDIPAGAYS